MEKFNVKLILRDNVFKLLFINMILVIIGYAGAYAIGMWFVSFFRVFKLIFVFSSLFYIVYKNGFSTLYLLNKINIYLVVFAVFILSFLAENPFSTVYKALTFIFPLIYIVYSINYLLKYGALNLLIGLSLMILIVYAIVPLSYYLVGGSLTGTVIYGYTEGDYFVSNHYGWGSVLFILSAFSVLRFYPLKLKFKLVIYIFLPFVFYLLIISANRAGIISLVIAFIFFLIRDKQIGKFNKIFITVIPLSITILTFSPENSAIKFLQQKNEAQIETGQEGRLLATLVMLDVLDEEPERWITGFGMFNYSKLKERGSILNRYHNSYWEVLFGSGIFVFLLFIGFMMYRPLIVFWKVTASYSLLLIPLMLIPFFESNITAGQFLFFPWIAYMILLNSKEFYIETKLDNY